MTHDEYNERSIASLLKDLMANQHSLYEDMQAVMEKLDYLENRIEAVLAAVPGDVEEADAAPTIEEEEQDNSFDVIDLSEGDDESDDPTRVDDEVGENEVTTPSRLDPDELYDVAEAFVIEQGKATQALLQHELQVSAERAKHLLALLEAEGVVGPLQPGKSRQVKITMMAE